MTRASAEPLEIVLHARPADIARRTTVGTGAYGASAARLQRWPGDQPGYWSNTRTDVRTTAGGDTAAGLPATMLLERLWTTLAAMQNRRSSMGWLGAHARARR